MKRPIAIVGGGLAGIATAVRLAEAGETPVLIETKKRLGGRATSFVDPRTGYTLDNCQHVLMGCCTNAIDLFDRLGVLERVDWHTSLYWTRGRGEYDRVGAGWLPAPLHMAPSFQRMRSFTLRDKRHMARAIWRMLRLGTEGRYRWRGRTFGEFLSECQQPDDLVVSFWNAIIVGACNLPVDRVSAEVALKVFQEGFLGNRWSYTLGIPSVPLDMLYDTVVRMIENAGGEVHTGTSVKSIDFDGTRVSGVTTADGIVAASAVVSAVPADRLDRLVSGTLRARDQRLTQLSELGTSPILGVHLFFETEVMPQPHLVLIERDVEWLFNKGVTEEGHQHVHAVVSAADAWMDLDEEVIVRRVLDDIWHVLPGSKGLEPIAARSIKERRATFSVTPDGEEMRPPVAPSMIGVHGGGIENLFLAGDWCDTGWPATMESAVRSGYMAAEAVTGAGGLVEDVPTGWLVRLLRGRGG